MIKFLIIAVGIAQNIYGVLPPIVTVVSTKSSFTKNDCKMLISQHESQNNIPNGLLAAIANVESGFGPYAVNCNGASYQFSNLKDAKAYVDNLRSRGIIDINIGPLQINYAYHQTKFANASSILDPYKNITYAAKYLAYLYKFHGYSWEKAVRFYHSPVDKYQKIYIAKVMGYLKQNNFSTYQDLNGKKSVKLKLARANHK
jgi:hypothetical protein